MTLAICLLIQIMLIMLMMLNYANYANYVNLVVRLTVANAYLSGNGETGPIVVAAVSSRSTAGPPGPRMSRMFAPP